MPVVHRRHVVLPEAVAAELSPDGRAAGEARRVVREALSDWRLMSRFDDMILVASELVGNCVRHAKPPYAIGVFRGPARLRLAVQDATTAAPTGLDDDHQRESGRGIAITSAVADEVFVEPGAEGGKIVSACFNHKPHPA